MKSSIHNLTEPELIAMILSYLPEDIKSQVEDILLEWSEKEGDPDPGEDPKSMFGTRY